MLKMLFNGIKTAVKKSSERDSKTGIVTL